MRRWYVAEVIAAFLAGIIISTFLLNSRIQELHKTSRISRSSPPKQESQIQSVSIPPDGHYYSINHQDDNLEVRQTHQDPQTQRVPIPFDVPAALSDHDDDPEVRSSDGHNHPVPQDDMLEVRQGHDDSQTQRITSPSDAHPGLRHHDDNLQVRLSDGHNLPTPQDKRLEVSMHASYVQRVRKPGPPAGVGSVPGRVLYLWCSQGQEQRLFEFQHYLSVISVVTFLNPDVIEFHADVLPRPDDQFYNMWFEEVTNRYPFLVIKTVPSAVCSSEHSRKEFIHSQLSRLAGLYVGEYTILTPEIKHMPKWPYLNAMNENMEGLIIANSPLPQHMDLKYSYEIFNKYCDIHPGLESAGSKVCVIRSSTLYPRDAWGKNDVFSRLVRLLFHGSVNIKTIQPDHQKTPIPNIAHMIWLGPKQLDFLFYLSALSLLYVVKVDTLYLHVGEDPSGEFWDRVVSEPKVVVNHLWPGHDTVYGKTLRTYVHQSDMLRAKILYKYGGIYADVDALFANPFPDFLRYYDAVGSYDWPWYYANWPDYINNGVLMARPNATYLMHYLAGFKDYKSSMFSYNGLLKPYKTFERHPHLVMLYDRLQVICFKLRCHPTWVSNFRSRDMDHLVGPPLNWTDAVAFHITTPTPEELQSESALLEATGIWGELGRHVLRQAGRL